MSAASVALPGESIISKAFRDSGRPGIVKWEVLPVQDGDRIRLTFESVNGEGRHGVWLKTDLGVDVNGVKAPNVDLWADRSTTPARYVHNHAPRQPHLTRVQRRTRCV
jgi:hypothetical protein